MIGLRVAVERLRAAIERGETVLIYGDYDVDGTTAIVILKTAIELCGGRTEYHVPHRIREGYGMRDEVIEQAADRGIRAHHQRGHRHSRLCGRGDGAAARHRSHRYRPPPAAGRRRAESAGGGESQSGRLRLSLQVAVRRRSGLQDCASAAGERPDASGCCRRS